MERNIIVNIHQAIIKKGETANFRGPLHVVSQFIFIVTVMTSGWVARMRTLAQEHHQCRVTCRIIRWRAVFSSVNRLMTGMSSSN